MFFCNFQSSSLTSFFHNFWKVWNRTNSEIFANSEFSETAVFNHKTGFSKPFDPKTGNYFQTSKNELFQNMQKQKVQKFLTNAGP